MRKLLLTILAILPLSVINIHASPPPELFNQLRFLEKSSFEPTAFEFDPDGWILCLYEIDMRTDDQWEPLPVSFILYPAYPKPFNSSTTIRYGLPFSTHISLGVYDQLGRKMVNLFDGYAYPGEYSTILTAGGLPSGLYIVRLDHSPLIKGGARGDSVTRKVMLIR